MAELEKGFFFCLSQIAMKVEKISNAPQFFMDHNLINLGSSEIF